MIFKKQQNYTYIPPKKPLSKGRIALYIAICTVLFVLGFFSAKPIMDIVGMVL